MVLLDQFVARTRLGRGIRAVAQDSETATLMGVNRRPGHHLHVPDRRDHGRLRRMLYMIRYGITRYDVGFLLGVKAFTAAVLGGIGNLRGALLGGLVLGLVENYGSAIFGSQMARRHRVRHAGGRADGAPDRTPWRVPRKGPGVSTSSATPPACASAAPTGATHCPAGGARARVRSLVLGLAAHRRLLPAPHLKPPLLSTPDTDFGGVLFVTATYAVVCLGLNVVVGQAGLLDLGYVGFFAVGAYATGLFTVQHAPRCPTWPPSPSPSCSPSSPACCSAHRRCDCGATTWPS